MGPIILATLVLLSWHPLFGASQTQSDDVCRVSRCRDAKIVTVELPGGGTSEIRVPRSAIIRDGAATVFLGERIVLALEPAPDGTFRLTAPLEEPAPDKKVELVLKQESLKPGQPKVTLLIVTSSLDRLIHYQADMVLLPEEVPQRTSVCPLRPGVLMYEMWPHPVPLLVVRNFVVAAENTPCK